MLHQTQNRIEILWNEFQLSTLANGTSGESISSFSINAETRRLQRVESAIRRSLEQLTITPRPPPGDESVSQRYYIGNDAPIVTGPRNEPQSLSEGERPSATSEEPTKFVSSNSSAHDSIETIGFTVDMSDISSLSTGSSRGTRRVIRRWMRIPNEVEAIANGLYGEHFYHVCSNRRSYQGTCSFFLVSLVYAVKILATPVPRGCAGLLGSFALSVTATFLQVFSPHSMDEVVLSAVLLVVSQTIGLFLT